MSTGTVKLQRVFKAPPERLYRAFLEAQALSKWLPPYGFTCEVAYLDAQVGGRFHMSFKQFATAHVHGFGGEYLELVPNQRIVYTDEFDDQSLPGILHVTIELTSVICGTQLEIAQTGIPEVIPVAMCYLGWQESLAQLALLVEPELPS